MPHGEIEHGGQLVVTELITGGTTGIGFATARVLHEQGYAVVTTGRDPERIAGAKGALPEDVIVLRSRRSSP